ncbi:MAG: Asp-tRNA(Asn)/Glu-tRNA(Gln) amidotransferase subunit GatC [Cyanobacteria bacterium REEB65]|nr:Asp-tRNA(Asn)/Glu-tRNA(Gln) amidotransferase subunit GatC [Cyanobacteria bacterium REEB65]
MADISPETVRQVARLARLDLTSAEETLLATQLGQILGYVEKLDSVDTMGLEPTAHCLPLVNVLRVDEPRPSLPRDELLGAAPAAEDWMFKVPKIL